MKNDTRIFIVIIFTVLIMHIQLEGGESNISTEKSTMIIDKTEVKKLYQAKGNEEFIKKILAGSEFYGGLYSWFNFKQDNTFTLKFDDYQENEKFIGKGTWDVKDGCLVLKFIGKHIKWSGSYRLDVYRLAFDTEAKYRYTIMIYIKDKTPWHDQALGLDFN
ncbi:MAG TPA: hypothetical protein PK859_19365 [Spirochaetota bacterium]|nr:hypothetical protein [Spirochaetota bacterium]HPR50123.1 hypothetical protein [Spirochaetota bacterium]